MTNQEIQAMLQELEKEHSYYFDLWKDAGIATAGDIMNKIKETERKINDLKKMLNSGKMETSSIIEHEIPQLLQHNKISEALNLILANRSKKDLHNTCILLLAQYNDIENQRNMNLISFDEYKREKARIIHAILQIS